MDEQINDWITCKEAAAILGCRPRAVYRMIECRTLSVKRLPNTRPRVSRGEVAALAAGSITRESTT